MFEVMVRRLPAPGTVRDEGGDGVPIRSLVSYSIDRVEVMDPEGVVDEALMPDLSPEQIRRLYEHMVLTRQFDERMFKLQRQGRLGTFARVAGQEGAHVGAAFALRPEDWLVPGLPGDGGLPAARRCPMEQLLQYWSGDERGNAFPEGAAHAPGRHPGGHAHAARGGHRLGHEAGPGEDAAVLTFFGEGATSEGDFSEAMNIAAVFQVPVVFFCQNNQWAISVPYTKQTASPTVAQKALAYGMSGVQVDGNDVFAVYRVTKEALERARTGDEPTPDRGPHLSGDRPHHLRRCPALPHRGGGGALAAAGPHRAAGALHEDEGTAGRRRGGRRSLAEADRKVAEAVAAFEAHAAAGPEEIFTHVFAEMTPQLAEQQAELLRASGEEAVVMARLNMVEAIDQALSQEMERDPKVVVLGEDVGRDGGVFRVTDGLVQRFGEERVIDTPLAESGIVGMAIGMAIAGYRPVAEIQFSGFAYPAYDQLVSPRLAHAQPQPGRVHGAAGGADALRRRHPGAGAPFREHGSDLRPRPGAQGGHPGRSLRGQGPAGGRPSATPTRWSSWSRPGSTGPSRRRYRRSRTRSLWARRGWCARART